MVVDKGVFEDVARTILNENLRMKGGEKCLFFTDFNSRWEEERFEQLVERRRFLHGLYEGFRSCVKDFPGCIHDKYESTKRHGSEPGENIWRLAFGESVYGELLKRDLIWKLKAEVELSEDEWSWVFDLTREYSVETVDCVVAFPWYSVTHTRFRRLLNQLGCRFISMPMMTETVLNGPMRADWKEVSKKTREVYEILLSASSLHLRCSAGSDLHLEIGDHDWVHQDNGLFWEKGSFGNLPAGESYLVPKPGSASGVVVFTSGPDNPDIEPTPVIVENGKVAEFGSETLYSEILERKFEGDVFIRHVAELGIGTNPLARDVSSMIEGEKIQGTVHVALGDDSSIGGDNEATEHLDHIIVGCTLVATLDDGSALEIVKDGRLLV